MRVFQPLADAKAAVYALTTTPFQRAWVERLQEVQLKMEVAGTSRIEGAEFTERELETALRESAGELLTRSQRQAHAAVQTYRWIASLPADRPVTVDLVTDIHRRIVTGCDDDHCEPGGLRPPDYNVTFGVPPHRGADGGTSCQEAFHRFVDALAREFRAHDSLIQSLAAHYHLAAMHPFQDGNGRTARALEALLLQRAGLRDSAFIAMSNYYYENKSKYLEALAAVRASDHDLTAFLVLGLEGIATQCRRLFSEIRREMQKALFRNTMYDLFNRLANKRKRVMGERQVRVLNMLLEVEDIELGVLWNRAQGGYATLSSPAKAFVRDINSLQTLGAAQVDATDANGPYIARARLEWPTEITESEFFRRIQALPRGTSYPFLRQS